MRAYLAILRDSFHEALASRVLWVLLLLTTLFLALIAPLGIVEEAGSYLNDEDFLDQPSLEQKLIAGGAAAAASPSKHIWEALSPALQKRLLEKPAGGDADMTRFMTMMSVREELNHLLIEPDFYDETAWTKVKLDHESRQLLKRGLDELPSAELARFNRLAIQAAFPDEIAVIQPKQIQLSYLVWKPGVPLPIDRDQLRPVINQVLMLFMEYLLGVIGILIAVLVTASIIPQTFEAGAIDLLLSKPIARPLLFLTKFFGGCTFIAINAVYFIGGLWLLIGLRLGLWNDKLLLCIPLYLFLFSIIYSVSALAGVIWRNAIVSVVLAISFWAACWTLGFLKGQLETWALNPKRIEKLIAAGDTLIAINHQNQVTRWREADRSWEAIFVPSGKDAAPFGMTMPLVGPVYDAKNDRLLALERPLRRFGPLSSSATLVIGQRGKNWKRSEGIAAPDDATELFVTASGDVVATAPNEIYLLRGDPEAKQQRIELFGLRVPLPDTGGRFVDAGPSLRMKLPMSSAIDSVSGSIAVYDGDKLILCEREDSGSYKIRQTLKEEAKEIGVLALNGNHLAIGLGDGAIELLDARTLKIEKTLQPAGGPAVRALRISPDENYLAALYSDGRLWLYNLAKQQPDSTSIAGQGDVSAIAFSPAGALLVADRLTRVSEYDLASGRIERQVQPDMPVLDRLYRYGLEPLYFLFPKPGKLAETINHVLTEGETAPSLRPRPNLNVRLKKVDVWGPVWSNLAFLAAMLAIGSVYVYRKDF